MTLRRTDATPCPGGLQAYHQRPRDSIISLGGDNTEDLDFTTEFRASLRAIKPRRRQTAIGAKRKGHEVEFAIHEDREVQPSSAIGLKGSILAKPPQRPKHRVSFLPGIKESGADQRWQILESRSDMAPALASSRNGAMDSKAATDSVKREDIIKRPARRGTVYIPSDDTTMPSMHMGIFSPIKELQTGTRSGDQDATVEFTGLAAQMAKKRGRRESLVTAPPKRVPLQQPAQVRQESASPRAVAGKRTGKENVPPGQLGTLLEGDSDETKLFDLSQPDINKRRLSVVRPVKHAEPSSRFGCHKKVCVEAPVAKEIVRSSGYRKPPIPHTITTFHVKEIKRYQNRPSAQPVSSYANRRSSLRPPAPGPQIFLRKETIPAKLSIPKIPQIELQQQYPLLSENISDPSLYEDSWLTHQEIAITQLVNTLFQTSQGAEVPPDVRQLRHELLVVYQDPSFSLLHKRLQASLLYGALSMSKDVLARGSRLWTDLGRRERFCSFWLDTYDLTCLTAALEVVIGRECSATPRTSQDGRSSTLKSTTTLSTEAPKGQTSRMCNSSRRSVRAFLECFLIRNEDGSPEIESPNCEAWSYQRTVLRSLMLIKLLDRLKTTSRSPSSLCLFLPTSSYKSSVGVVKGLAQMLNPTIGDVLRLLSYLDYTVDHKQYPLEEYNYHIENLAVDLRDGVILTRLVELLLYPTSSHSLARANEAEATTTVVLPGGETLCLLQGGCGWPLSQHLKFPCIGQATKLYNVQLALGALSGVRGMDSLIRDIRAEDIVNGFREKTVALLWGLTGKWGLGGMLDWGDVHREIRRLSKSCQLEHEEYLDDSEEGFEVHKARLKAWASAVACNNGLEVRNLSTSFSDGRVFSAIVEEYATYLDDTSQDRAHNLLLHERLQRLGCSGQFGKQQSAQSYSDNAKTDPMKLVRLFAPVPGVPVGRFFDRDFVVAALGFLCSRLLSATKRARAAVTIQRRWRQFHGRAMSQRRLVAKRVAEQCMAVVQARERLLWAKTVILKSWRAHRYKIATS
jgi:abnormal spindle-like microcephaly-associated protein